MSASLQPPWVLPALLTLEFLSFLVPPFRLRPLVFVPPLLYLNYLFFSRPISLDSAASFGAASLWPINLRVLVLHLLRHPAELHFPLVGTSKPAWVFHLLTSLRTVGFPGYPQPPPHRFTTRSSYVAWVLKRLAILYALLDLCRAYTLSNLPKNRATSIIALTIPAWGMIEMQYLTASVLAVGTGISKPESWPPLFGDVREAYTVRRLWGRVWHQLLRRTLVDIGRAISRERFVIVCTGFVVSAVGHMLGAMAVRRELWRGHAKFFLTQGALVVAEEAAKKWCAPARRWWRTELGYVWVLATVVWTGRWLEDEWTKIGLLESDPVPWSPVRWGLGKLGMW